MRPSGVTKTLTREYPGDQRCTAHSGRKANWWPLGLIAIGVACTVYAGTTNTPEMPPMPSHSLWVQNPDIPGQGMWIHR